MTVPAQVHPPWDDDPGTVREPDWRAEPADEELWGLVPDLDADLQDEPGAWLADDMPEAVGAYLASQPTARAKPWDLYWPGGLSRPGGTVGAGFAAGGAADHLAAGLVLAGLTTAAWERREQVSDDERIGIACAWRRLSAWVTAAELGAVAELVARRDAQVTAGADPHLAQHVADEVAAALTMTIRSADQLADFAVGLERLPATRAALTSGDIDEAKAWVIYDGVTGLEPGHAAAVEKAVIGRAGQQTTGQLRAAVRQAVLAADPQAADRRREEARKQARVETWDERSGTAALAGRDLPPADVLAADRRIDAFARELRTAGATGTLDGLRARVYTALLLGVPMQALLAQLQGPGPAAPSEHQTLPAPPVTSPAADLADAAQVLGSQPLGAQALGSQVPGSQVPGSQVPGSPTRDWRSATGFQAPGFQPQGFQPQGLQAPRPQGLQAPAGLQARDSQSPGTGSVAGVFSKADSIAILAAPPLTGSVNLTMPLTTWLGGEAPGETAGFGPIPATDAQMLARLLAGQPGTRWCVTITGSDGTALAHGCARLGGSGRGTGSRLSSQDQELTITIKPLSLTTCHHTHEVAGYRPSDHLRHLVTVRQRTCSAPGCRRPAQRCDLDHTIPYGQGGRTCECDLAPLCRRHHRAKQAQGWHLEQPEPGTMVWTLPHGRSYRTGPSAYPADGP